MTNNSQKKYPILELIFGAAILLFVGLLFGSGNIDEATTFTTLCGAVACGLWTTSGVFIILQKEVPRPGLPSTKGIGAVITGVLTVIMFGTGTIILLFSFIKDLLLK